MIKQLSMRPLEWRKKTDGANTGHLFSKTKHNMQRCKKIRTVHQLWLAMDG